MLYVYIYTWHICNYCYISYSYKHTHTHIYFLAYLTSCHNLTRTISSITLGRNGGNDLSVHYHHHELPWTLWTETQHKNNNKSKPKKQIRSQRKQPLWTIKIPSFLFNLLSFSCFKLIPSHILSPLSVPTTPGVPGRLVRSETSSLERSRTWIRVHSWGKTHKLHKHKSLYWQCTIILLFVIK